MKTICRLHVPLIMLLITLTVCACTSEVNTPTNVMDKFEEFKNKEKFVEDTELFYPGIADESMRPVLSDKINLAADDFRKLVERGNASEAEYHKAIKKGLEQFNDDYINLDTEDRGRICAYFEELMDIIGLESSGGHLNKFMYGFDSTE